MPRNNGASWKNFLARSKSKNIQLLFKILISETEVLGETNRANEFNNFFTDIGLKLTKKIPESSQFFERYMKKVNSEMETKTLSINEFKDVFFLWKLRIQVMMILVMMLLVNALRVKYPTKTYIRLIIQKWNISR